MPKLIAWITGKKTPASPYTIDDSYLHKEFVDVLKPPAQAQLLRFGCLAGSDSACVAAGKFLKMFSEAGWKIDGYQVYRLTEAIPTEGISLVTKKDASLLDLPPHLGRWYEMDDSGSVILVELGARPSKAKSRGK